MLHRTEGLACIIVYDVEKLRVQAHKIKTEKNTEKRKAIKNPFRILPESELNTLAY
jgi:hypothetical protein